MSSLPCQPPNAAQASLSAFHAFLTSLETASDVANSGGNSASEDALVQSSRMIQARRKQILRVAECLFGNLLEGALTTLDSYNLVEIFATQSRRRMCILANVRSSRRNSRQEEPTGYFCLIPDSLPIIDGSIQHSLGTGFLFCSCRSYFERTKTKPGRNRSSASPQATICKHLLAFKLRPYVLQEKCEVIETVTEDKFSQEVLRRLC